MTSGNEHAYRVHEFLCSTQAYPERPKRIEVVETHISWVYLTDRYVYKQKKPVQFEFLDFSTPEKRKHFCQQEVAQNQRFSPDVYLGLVPVFVTSEGYQLKQGVDIAEWLVKMTRLDEAKTLESLVRNRKLTASQLKQLSHRLTDVYSAQAPALLRSQDYLESLRRHILANCDDLLIHLPEHKACIEYVTNAQLRCLTLESDYFMQRVADGRVVDGHGDLRPEHIYFRRGKPAIIDCIEFNEEYRKNDVIDELSFLAMECDRLGNLEVGGAILSAYLATSSDDSHPFLVAFYKCYRACVRAKVAALRAAQSSDEQQRQALDLAQEYLDLARGYAVEIGPKLILMVGGLSGTGKSTLAHALGDSLGAELLQTDIIRQELYQPGIPNGKYTLEGRQRVYDEMIRRIGGALRHSSTVVLDGTFHLQTIRKRVLEIANQLHASVLQVQCECDRDVAHDRIVQRISSGAGASEATPTLPARQAESYELPLSSLPCITINSTLPLLDQVKEVLAGVASTTDATGRPQRNARAKSEQP